MPFHSLDSCMKCHSSCSCLRFRDVAAGLLRAPCMQFAAAAIWVCWHFWRRSEWRWSRQVSWRQVRSQVRDISGTSRFTIGRRKGDSNIVSHITWNTQAFNHPFTRNDRVVPSKTAKNHLGPLSVTRTERPLPSVASKSAGFFFGGIALSALSLHCQKPVLVQENRKSSAALYKDNFVCTMTGFS